MNLHPDETQRVQQSWNAAEYQRHAAFVPALAHEVVMLLNPRPGEEILDLGCGDGSLTAQMQNLGCSVTGIDSSQEMVAAARERGVDAHLVDGHSLTFSERFDAVFSNAALHWLIRPESVIAGVPRALKPAGRFVGEFGGRGNLAALVEAMRKTFAENPQFGSFDLPWFFPSVDEYRHMLENAGFEVRQIELIPRPTPLESGIEKWLEIFADGITRQLSLTQKSTFMESVKRRLVDTLYTDETGWVADYVRLRFAAFKR